MSDGKGGFLEGLKQALEPKDKEADSPQVVEVKNLILSKDLTRTERADLAGWLIGDTIVSAIEEALNDDNY